MRRLLVISLVAAGLTVPGAAPAAADACAPLVNPIACENTRPGTPASTWDVSGAGSASLQGFSTQISVDAGRTVDFKIRSTAASYRVDIYRMGYYGGNGARLVATVNPVGRQTQPACQSQAATGLVDCGNWAVSASWQVPATAVSGIYFARPTRTDGTSGASHIPFVVRADASRSDLVFQTSDTTWQAYNQYGGNSLYVGSPAGRAYQVSYNRPFGTRGTGAEDFVFNAEYPMVRWLEANGYDVSYIAGADTDRAGALLRNHKVFLSVGHDEYWSAQQRANVEAARDAGVHLAFLSGNEVFWKTRWENDHRTLVTYKETHADGKIDPSPAWTGSWRDPRFSPPADGGRPENALTGTIFKVNAGTVSLRVPAADGKMRFWRGTSVATQAAGATATLGSGTVGYEWDEDADNGVRPRGLIRLSTTSASGLDVLQDYGSTYATGSATHHLTLYRVPSGALVFGAGTVQWSWGLDSSHDRGSGAASTPMRQATVNLLADMGVQPGTLQAGLTAATASTDSTGPAATIDPLTAQVGSPVTVSGTATDTGGGVTGGVEVSTDDGITWHPAEGRGTWTYGWRPGSTGTTTVRVRAADDSGNVGPDASRVVTVGARTCPCSVWGPDAVPATPADPDTAGTEVGTGFRTDVAGRVTAIRFYKSATNTGTHVGHLWSADGTPLASVTFTGESASGWQQATLATPVTLAPDTPYVVSYYAPNGQYAADVGMFAEGGIDNAPLHASQGFYRYGTGFPAEVWENAGYYADVVFEAQP
ncbi:N,N-dimethylformamidase beta subunit family domain-containing protein [Actinoplanes sp. RD1]|uniref:N,N-dimethylformamidase beta subunit family domain-containing protein n=1 Tax=Actinoplanes sp. RD1 TaxID=3064538 RepID=UPI0027429DA9|nr:N,N-dimethylformamidase beta subunit family domain-containing protein [Actinoplanes sp. RD1]